MLEKFKLLFIVDNFYYKHALIFITSAVFDVYTNYYVAMTTFVLKFSFMSVNLNHLVTCCKVYIKLVIGIRKLMYYCLRVE